MGLHDVWFMGWGVSEYRYVRTEGLILIEVTTHY